MILIVKYISLQHRRNHFISVLILCLFLYPFVPTIGYIVNLWYLGMATYSTSGYNMKTARLEMFARVSHSITGCIEAPIQMVMTIFLMMKGVLALPWDTAWHRNTVTDSKGNEMELYIPAVTLIFSMIDMIKCSLMINIFNVYIGQLNCSDGFKYYVNLAAGHLPFFLHSICLRVFAFAFFIIYLNEINICIPLILIWVSNLIIGYMTSKPRLSKRTRAALKKIEDIERGKTSIPEFEKEKDAPIWLNSFLSIFVPSCSLDLIDPAMVDYYSHQEIEITRNDKVEKVPGEQVKKDVIKFNKTYQQKIIQRQLIVSSTIILMTVGLIFHLVEEVEDWNYSKNILSNFEFRMFFLIFLVMSLFSLLFVVNIDIFETFRLNGPDKTCLRTTGKVVLVFVMIALIIR